MNLIDFIVACAAVCALWSIATAAEDIADELARIRDNLFQEDE